MTAAHCHGGGGGFFSLVDLGLGAAASGMGIEINTGHIYYMTQFPTKDVAVVEHCIKHRQSECQTEVYIPSEVDSVSGPLFHQVRGSQWP